MKALNIIYNSIMIILFLIFITGFISWILGNINPAETKIVLSCDTIKNTHISCIDSEYCRGYIYETKIKGSNFSWIDIPNFNPKNLNLCLHAILSKCVTCDGGFCNSGLVIKEDIVNVD